MTRMRDLPKGAVFRISPAYPTSDRNRHLVKVPASAHPHGWVEVWDLDMTDEQARQRGAEPGYDAREGVFMDGQTDMDVEVLA